MTAVLSGTQVKNVAFCLKSLPTHVQEEPNFTTPVRLRVKMCFSKYEWLITKCYYLNIKCSGKLQICLKSAGLHENFAGAYIPENLTA